MPAVACLPLWLSGDCAGCLLGFYLHLDLQPCMDARCKIKSPAAECREDPCRHRPPARKPSIGLPRAAELQPGPGVRRCLLCVCGQQLSGARRRMGAGLSWT